MITLCLFVSVLHIVIKFLWFVVLFSGGGGGGGGRGDGGGGGDGGGDVDGGGRGRRRLSSRASSGAESIDP